MRHILTIALSALALSGCAATGNYNTAENSARSHCRMATPLPGSRLGPTCDAGWGSSLDNTLNIPPPFYDGGGTPSTSTPSVATP